DGRGGSAGPGGEDWTAEAPRKLDARAGARASRSVDRVQLYGPADQGAVVHQAYPSPPEAEGLVWAHAGGRKDSWRQGRNVSYGAHAGGRGAWALAACDGEAEDRGPRCTERDFRAAQSRRMDCSHSASCRAAFGILESGIGGVP